MPPNFRRALCVVIVAIVAIPLQVYIRKTLLGVFEQFTKVVQPRLPRKLNRLGEGRRGREGTHLDRRGGANKPEVGVGDSLDLCTLRREAEFELTLKRRGAHTGR